MNTLSSAVFFALIWTGLPLCADVCNPKDLQGPYGFQLSGETDISGQSQSVTNIGRIVLAGDGKISGYSTVMFAGYLLGNPVNGTYEAQWDCTITWSLQDDSGAFQHFSGIATSNGKKVHFSQTDPGGAQHGAMARTPVECKTSDLRPKYKFSLSGSTIAMVPGGTASIVTAKGVIQSDDNAAFKLDLGDDSAPMSEVTITVDAECTVTIELTLPSAGPATTIPTMLRGILTDDGNEIIAIEVDPGAMVSATFTAY